MDPRELGFDEDDAKRILQRAAALDVRIVGRLTIDEIRLAACEAGISETAVSIALAEASGTPAAPASRFQNIKASVGMRLRSLSALAAAFGFAAGAVSVPFSYQRFSLNELGTVAGLLLAVSIAGAARAIKHERFSAYRILNGVMWIGFGAGYIMMNGAPQGVGTVAGMGWAISTGVSALLMALKMYLSAAPPSTDEINAAAGA